MTTKPEYVAPMTFEEAVKDLDEGSEAHFHDLIQEVEFTFDDMQGYEEGIADALRAHFGCDEHSDIDDFHERMQAAHHATGMLEDGTEGGYRVTISHLYEQLQPDPEVQRANEPVQAAVANLRAAHHAFNEVWARKLMAEHKAAWEKGVADAEKYVPLLGDLFQPDEAAE
jgi:uncharacterized protein YukE